MMSDKIAEFVSLVPEGEQRKASSLKEKYLANRHNMQGLDHAMKLSIHVAGLARFLPERRPAALPAGGHRFLVPLGSLDPDVAEASPGREFRCCAVSGEGEP